eukprot:c18018_g1_i2 orf=152-1171(-)
MSMEATSRAGKSSPDGSKKKSKKGHKRKVEHGAEMDDAECDNEVPVLNSKGANEVQSVPSVKRNKREEKILKDVRQQVQASREETQENGQQRSPKQVRFNLESSIMPLDQEKRDSMEEGKTKDNMMVRENEAIEENKPNDTSWVQRASWKSLVGGSGRVAFSLGTMMGEIPSSLPGGNINSTAADARQPCADVQPSNNVSAWIDGSTSVPSFESSGRSNNHSNLSHAKKESKFIRKSEAQSDSGRLNHLSVKTPHDAQGGLKVDPQKVKSAIHENASSHDVKQMVQNDCQSGVEVCTFMRSDNYEQEWLEAKRAVKEIFKRSRKDALRSMKMFHTKHNQ